MSDNETREKCPTCPADGPGVKQRRARCPVCKEWIYYTPDHPGHKLFVQGKWRKPIFKPADIAWLRHSNSHTQEQFMSMYEKVEVEP